MDPGEEQLDYGDEDSGQNRLFQIGGAISALVEEEVVEDDEYDDLYQDVNVGFIQAPQAIENSVEQIHFGKDRGQHGGVGHLEEYISNKAVQEGVNEADLGSKEVCQEIIDGKKGDEDKTEIQRMDQERIDCSHVDLPLTSKSEKDEDIHMEKKAGCCGRDPIIEARNVLPGAMSSTISPVLSKDPGFLEEDESEMPWDPHSAASYDRREEEGDNLGVVSHQMQSIHASQAFAPPLNDSSSRGLASAQESNAEAVHGQGYARNGNFGNRGSVRSVKGLNTGGLDVGQPVGKGGGGGFMPDTTNGRGGTPTSAASTPNRNGPNRDLIGTSMNEHAARQGRSNSHSGESGGTMLFVGELQWWTTDAELEAALSEYGELKDLKFFEEKASGKSRGYCQVEFYDHAAARACKEGMNGRIFNGRPCVVAFASSSTVRQMGVAQVNKAQVQQQVAQPHTQTPSQTQQRRMMNDGGGRGGSSYQSGEAGRNYGKMGSGRSGHGHGMGIRGQGGQGRGKGGMGGRSMGGGSSGGGSYGQGLAGPMGGPPGGMMQGIMGQGFDPTYGSQMGRGGGGYGGFVPHGPLFSGMVPTFPAVGTVVPAVGTVGLPVVAPHVNPAFFGRNMNNNGMGIIPSSGMDGHNAAMWTDSSTSKWGGEEPNRRINRRMRDTSYGEDLGSEYGYGDIRGRSNAPKDRHRGAESDWAGSSERRHRDDFETDWDRDRYREKDRDSHRDQRERERDWDKEDDWEKEKILRARSKSRIIEEEDPRPRSKESDYGKRQRLAAERYE